MPEKPELIPTISIRPRSAEPDLEISGRRPDLVWHEWRVADLEAQTIFAYFWDHWRGWFRHRRIESLFIVGGFPFSAPLYVYSRARELRRLREEITRLSAAEIDRREELETTIADAETALAAGASGPTLTEMAGRLTECDPPSWGASGGLPPRLLLRDHEVVLLTRRAALSAVRHDGFELAGTAAGRYSGTSAAISVAEGSVTGSAAQSAGRFGATIRGTLTRMESEQIRDRGWLVLTSHRVLFVGTSQTDEIDLASIVSVDGSVDSVVLSSPRRQHAERYRVCDGDAIARLVTALRGRQLSGRPSLASTRSSDGGQDGDGEARPIVSAAGRVERDCPYCAERILARARVCKHCGRDVSPLSEATS